MAEKLLNEKNQNDFYAITQMEHQIIKTDLEIEILKHNL